MCVACKKEFTALQPVSQDLPHINKTDIVIYTEISGMSEGLYNRQNPIGAYGEIVVEIQKRIGDNTDIQILPLARAYSYCLTNANTILFPMNRTPEREDLFLWVGPLFEIRYSLYAKRGSNIKITSLDAAKQFKAIGTVQGDTREDFLKEHGFTNLENTHDNELNIRKLFADRVQLITGSSTGIVKQMERAGYALDQIEEVYTLFKGALYIAFSKNTDINIYKKWEKAFKDMLNDGTYKKIIKKWYPEEKL